MLRSSFTRRRRYLPAATVLRNGVWPSSRPFNQAIAHGRTRIASSPFRRTAAGEGAPRGGRVAGGRAGGSAGGGTSWRAGPAAAGGGSGALTGLAATVITGWTLCGAVARDSANTLAPL